MIDFDFEIKNIQHININNMELSRLKFNDNIRKAIILYNKAIAEIRTNNLELAIKDLKKSLHYNSGFAEAMKLLGLCYVNSKEYKKAEKTFKKMVKQDMYKEAGEEYISGLLIEKNVSKTMLAIKRAKGSCNSEKNQYTPSRKLIKIILGISILSVFIIVFIVNYKSPAILKTFTSKFKVSDKIANSEVKVNEDSVKDKTAPTIENEDYKNIEKKLDATKSELDNYKSKYNILLTLNEAEKLYNDRNYEKAASTLLDMKNVNLDNETKMQLDKLWSNIKSNGLWNIYNEGNKLYKVGKYKEALPKFIMVSKIDPNLSIMPWLTYQIGTCYKETNDNANALVFFQKVKTDYPKSQYVSSSERMISKIQNK